MRGYGPSRSPPSVKQVDDTEAEGSNGWELGSFGPESLPPPSLLPTSSPGSWWLYLSLVTRTLLPSLASRYDDCDPDCFAGQYVIQSQVLAIALARLEPGYGRACVPSALTSGSSAAIIMRGARICSVHYVNPKTAADGSQARETFG